MELVLGLVYFNVGGLAPTFEHQSFKQEQDALSSHTL